MQKIALFCCVLFAGCINLNHHEQMTPHWESSSWNCMCEATVTHTFDTEYRDANQYMQNARVKCSDSTERYAITRLTINDTITLSPDSMHSAAFEIPLSDYHFKRGDAVHIVVEHYGCALPKLLNPEVR